MRVVTCGAVLVLALISAGCAATERAREIDAVAPPVVEAAPADPVAPSALAARPWWVSDPREEPAPAKASPAATGIRGRVEFAEPISYREAFLRADFPDSSYLYAEVLDDGAFAFAHVPAGAVATLSLFTYPLPYDVSSSWPTWRAQAGDQAVVVRVPPRPSVTLRLRLAPHMLGQGWTFLVSADELHGREFRTRETWILAPGDTLHIPWVRKSIDRLRVSHFERGVAEVLRDIPADGREVVVEVGVRREIFGRVRAHDGSVVDDLTVLAVAEGREVRRSTVGPGGHFSVAGLEDDRWRLVVVAGKLPDELTLFDVSKLRALTSVEARWGDEDVTIDLP